MIETKNWERIKYYEVPYEVAEFCNEMMEVEQSINFMDKHLVYKKGRDYVRRKLLNAKNKVSNALSRFNRLLLNAESSEDKKKELHRVIKKLSQARLNMEAGKTEVNIVKAKVPSTGSVQVYHNLLSKIVRELIYGCLLKAAEENNKNEFYENLFEEAWEWSTIQCLVLTSPEGEEASEEKEIEQMGELNESEIIERMAS